MSLSGSKAVFCALALLATATGLDSGNQIAYACGPFDPDCTSVDPYVGTYYWETRALPDTHPVPTRDTDGSGYIAGFSYYEGSQSDGHFNMDTYVTFPRDGSGPVITNVFEQGDRGYGGKIVTSNGCNTQYDADDNIMNTWGQGC